MEGEKQIVWYLARFFWLACVILLSLLVISDTSTTSTQIDWNQGILFNNTATNSTGDLYLAHTNYSEMLRGLGIDSSGLMILYHLNNESAFGENSSRVYDFSGSGNNGTVVNSAGTPINGRFNSTFKKIGTGSLALTPNGGSLGEHI